jgi:hypothetical protein
MKNKDFGLIFYLHLVLILAIWSSPFWLNWKTILFFIFLYYLELFFFGNCILTTLEFNELERNTTFYSHYLEKLGFKFNKRKLSIFLDYIFPWLILGLALIYQKT